MLSREQFERALSPARAARYLQATDHDLAAAVELYEHNSELSAKAWIVIADVEVILRNIVATSIAERHAVLRPGGTQRWYDDPSWFDQGRWLTSQTLKSIDQAKRRVNDPGPGGRLRPPEGRMVAELTLGFWRYLLISRYEHSLWNPAIRAEFAGLEHLSGSESRRSVHRRVEQLNYLRNRVAHHEPIYEPFTLPDHTIVDADDVLGDAVEMISWAHPQAAAWISSRL